MKDRLEGDFYFSRFPVAVARGIKEKVKGCMVKITHVKRDPNQC